MNERIKELAEQAMWHTNSKTGEVYRTHFQFEERFAELIIKECGTALNPMLRDMISRGQAHQLIKEHFGIKDEPET